LIIGHGRLEERTVSLASIEPMAVDFAFARSILIIEAQRLENKSAKTTAETRYYLSSLESQERTPQQWLEVVRGHWAGVENRNHWRRDACLGEDRTSSRNANVLINLALLRNATLCRPKVRSRPPKPSRAAPRRLTR
jgi:predicted transposase YbfD/YdcC